MLMFTYIKNSYLWESNVGCFMQSRCITSAAAHWYYTRKLACAHIVISTSSQTFIDIYDTWGSRCPIYTRQCHHWYCPMGCLQAIMIAAQSVATRPHFILVYITVGCFCLTQRFICTTRLILSLHSANGRRRCKATPSLIGCAQT